MCLFGLFGANVQAQVPSELLGISLDNPAFLREFNLSFETGLRPGAPGLDIREATLLNVVEQMYVEDLDGALSFLLEELRTLERRIELEGRSQGTAARELGYEPSANIEYAIGQLYQLNDNQIRAEQYYLRAIEKYPAYVDAYARLMEIYLVREDCDKAMAAGRRAIEVGGFNGPVFRGMGICHYLNGDYDAALSSYRVALNFLQDDESVMYFFVLSALNTGSTREAIAVLDQLIEQDSTDARYYMLQVNAYLQADDNQGALQTLEIARRVGVLNQSSYDLLGDIFVSMDMPEAALAAYSDALTGSDLPDFAIVVEQFDNLATLGDWDSAERFLQQIETRYGGSLITSQRNTLDIRLARVQLARNQPVDAVAALRRIVAADPTNGQALLSLAQYFRGEQDFEQAGIYFERAASEEAVALTALTEYAQLAADREDWQLAIDMLTRAAQLAPPEAVPTIQGNIRALLRVQEFVN